MAKWTANRASDIYCHSLTRLCSSAEPVDCTLPSYLILMKNVLCYLPLVLLILTGCRPDTDSQTVPAQGNPTADSSATAADATMDSMAAADESGQETRPSTLTALEDSLLSTLPELAECREMIMSDESGMRSEATREAGFANLILLPCGPSPGTGAYGFPMSLIAEWEAFQTTPEGDLERSWMPVEFSEVDPDGNVTSIGYVTQALPNWSEEDLEDGRFRLFYKDAGAGQCGRLVTYETPAMRAGFPFWEVRAQSCDMDEETFVEDPTEWEIVFSWDQ